MGGTGFRSMLFVETIVGLRGVVRLLGRIVVGGHDI